MNFQQLEALWIAQGGNAAYAPIMAAIAMAESTGNPTAYNSADPYGGSFGLWQINGSHTSTYGGRFDVNQLYNPGYNANAAIYVSGNGAGENWGGGNTDWSTWNDYVNGKVGTNGYNVISGLLGPWTGKLPAGAIAAGSSSSSSASSSAKAPATSAGSSSPRGASWLDAIGATPLVGPGLESIVSTGVILAVAIPFILIGGIWLIMGNETSRTIVVNTGKTAAKAGEAAAAIAA